MDPKFNEKCADDYGRLLQIKHRIGFLEGIIEGITMYAVWRDGQHTVGCLNTPLKEVIEPYRQELKQLKP